MKKRKKISFLTAIQASIITGSLFTQNDLGSCAAACAFGFLLSFFPVIMLSFTILVEVAHASKDVILQLVSEASPFKTAVDLSGILDSISGAKKIGIMELILGAWAFWMARNLFLYVTKGISKIFHTVSKSQKILNRILGFAIEVIIILGATLLILISISARTILRAMKPSIFASAPLLQKLTEILPTVFSSSTLTILKSAPFLFLFALILFVYRFFSGTKPAWKICLISAFLCTSSFLATAFALNLFLDINRYSIIYGVLGNLVILLFEVRIFFTLFFAFGEFIFVHQYFDKLLIAELYLLPGYDEKNIFSSIRRMLFIRPDALAYDKSKVHHFNKGETIFDAGGFSEKVFYISRGSVIEQAENRIEYHERGSFFGEIPCILNCQRKTSVIANSDCDVLEIDSEIFKSLSSLNSAFSAKVLSSLSSDFNKLYGRAETFLI